MHMQVLPDRKRMRSKRRTCRTGSRYIHKDPCIAAEPGLQELERTLGAGLARARMCSHHSLGHLAERLYRGLADTCIIVAETGLQELVCACIAPLGHLAERLGGGMADACIAVAEPGLQELECTLVATRDQLCKHQLSASPGPCAVRTEQGRHPVEVAAHSHHLCEGLCCLLGTEQANAPTNLEEISSDLLHGCLIALLGHAKLDDGIHSSTADIAMRIREQFLKHLYDPCVAKRGHLAERLRRRMADACIVAAEPGLQELERTLVASLDQHRELQHSAFPGPCATAA